MNALLKSIRAVRPRRWVLYLTAVLIIGATLRLGVFRIVSQHPERAITPDSNLYMDLGRNFSAAYVQNAPEWLDASIWRTPLYPLFCALCFRLFGDCTESILAAQIFVSLLCVGLAFLWAREIAGERAGLFAALLLSLDPLTISYANYVRAETIFTFLLFCAVSLWHFSLFKQSLCLALFAGLMFGLTVLTRPVTTYLLPVLVLVDLVLRKPRKPVASLHQREKAGMPVPQVKWLNHRLGLTFLMTTGLLLPVSVLVVRNHSVTGYWLVSSIEGTNILYYRAAGAVAAESEKTRVEVADRIKKQMSQQTESMANPAAICAREKRAGVRILLQHPKGALLCSVEGCARLLFGPGLKSLSVLLHGHESYDEPAQTGWPLQMVQFAIVGTIYLAAALGMVFLWRQRSFAALGTTTTVILYLVLISSGPESYSRFRVPLMPLLCILAALGIDGVFRRKREQTERQQPRNSANE